MMICVLIGLLKLLGHYTFFIENFPFLRVIFASKLKKLTEMYSFYQLIFILSEKYSFWGVF